MSENKFDFSVESIIAEIGIDEKYRRKNTKTSDLQQESEQKERDFRSEDEIIYVNKEKIPLVDCDKLSKKFKRVVKSLENRSKIVRIFLICSLYLTFSNILGLPLPQILTYIEYPYIFMLTNAVLHIFSIIFAVDIIAEGIKQIYRPNVYTLVTISTFFILLHTLSVIFLKNPLGYLPFNSVAIFIIYMAMQSFKDFASAKSYVYKICSMSTMLAFVSLDENRKYKYAFKKPTFNIENFSRKVSEDDNSILMSIYVYFYVIFAIVFSSYIAKGDLSMLFFSLSVISSLAVPINYLNYWTLPYKYASKKLFEEGIAIKSYSDIKKIRKKTNIILTDKDLFPENTVLIEYIKLCGNMVENDIISYVTCGFSKLNSCTKFAFESELQARYLQPIKCQKIDLIDENGFTFTANKKKISVGNSKFVSNLGLTVVDGFNIQNPLYVVISSKVVAIISLKHMSNPRLYNMISSLNENSIKIVVSTLDFTISSDLVERVYDISSKNIIFGDFMERYNQFFEDKELEENILITRQSGRSFVSAILTAQKLRLSVSINAFLGGLCSFVGLFIAGYLLYKFTPTILLPNNVLTFVIAWSIPTWILSFYYNN